MTTTDIAGLCERLRDAAAHVDGNGYCEALIPQPLTYAADTLERQAAEIERISSENATLTDEIDKIADQAFAADGRAIKAAVEIARMRGALENADRRSHGRSSMTADDREGRLRELRLAKQDIDNPRPEFWAADLARYKAARATLAGEDTAGSPTSQNTEPGLAFSDTGER